MEFKEVVKNRKSMRAYEETAISHEDLVSVLALAQQAPSWKNQQTSRCYVAETKDVVDKLRETALPAFNRKNSTNAVLIVSTFVTDVVGFEDGKPMNEAGNYWGAYDLGLHDAFLILAASDAGYDTLIMGLRDADIIREQLQIPENEQIMSVIAIGKKAKERKERPRKEFDEVVKFF